MTVGRLLAGLTVLVLGSAAAAQVPTATLGTKARFKPQVVSFSADGKALVVCGSGTATVYDAETNKARVSVKLLTGGSNAHALSSDNKRVAVACGKAVNLYDLAKPNSPLFTLKSDKDANAVAYSPDGKHVVTGANGGAVQLWDAASGKLVKSLKGHASTVTGIAFSPDGKTMATSELNKTVLLWDAAKGTQTGKLVDKVDDLKGPSAIVNVLAFGTEGKHLISVGPEGKSLLVWDVTEKKKVAEIAAPSGREISAAALAPDGKRLAVAVGGAVQFWDVASAKQNGAVETKQESLSSVAISPDGKTVAVGTGDGIVLLYAVPAE